MVKRELKEVYRLKVTLPANFRAFCDDFLEQKRKEKVELLLPLWVRFSLTLWAESCVKSIFRIIKKIMISLPIKSISGLQQKIFFFVCVGS